MTYKYKLEGDLGGAQAKTKKLDIPYCAACKAHVDWSTGGGYLGVFLSMILNLVLMGMLAGLLHLTWTSLSDWAYEHPDAVSWILGIVAVALLARRRLSAKNAPAGLTGRHTRKKESVEILGFKDGSHVRLRVHNQEWAEALSALNAMFVPGR